MADAEAGGSGYRRLHEARSAARAVFSFSISCWRIFGSSDQARNAPKSMPPSFACPKSEAA
jgi:hypothetical protein